jgi:16S rRNA (cytosine1402-N4)-methyltransferase
MPNEVVEALAVKPDGLYADGTLGGAGHAEMVLQRLTTGRLVGIDRDREAIQAATTRLKDFADRFVPIHGNFNQLPELISDLGIPALDGVLLDLGVSSHQLDTAERGFSYRLDGRLDMRMDDRQALTAYDIVNRYSEKQLAQLIFAYGEDRFAKRIARAVVAARPVETTLQLADLIAKAVPLVPRAGHPAKRAFQAIRIQVNNELDRLDAALRDITGLLKPGGRFCVITFHSLEDRIVKQCFKALANPCVCPRHLPYCACGQRPALKIITRKPVLPGDPEVEANPRAHSAKLRVAERI